MKERKQSFFERLTGTQSIADDITGESGLANGNVLNEKPWSKQADNVAEESKKKPYAKDTVVMETEEDEGSPEEREDGDDNAWASLAIDMYEEDNELIIQSMIAGVTPENLHITITRDMVTIEGKRIAPKGISEETYVERELYWGDFSREILLPFEIDTDGAEAVEKYGLLVIRLPRLDTTKTQELKVKSI
ncbi:MAG: Hsp20/alpha crystallin family protein [Patescibacteria group bacterium]